MWVVYLPIQHFVRGGIDGAYFNKLIGIFLSYRLHDYYFGMWFITCLYISELILFLLIKTTEKSEKYKTPLIILMIIVFSVSGKLITNYVKGFYWSIDLVPFAISFILTGYLLKLHGERLKEFLMKPYLAFISFALTVAFTVLCSITHNKPYDLYSSDIGNYFLYMAGAIIGTMFVISLSMIIKKNRPLEYIGKNTLVFYAFQNFIVIPMFDYILPVIYRLAGISTLPHINYLSFLITLSGSIVILSIISELFNRFFPFAVGKKKQK